ncbi:MAG: CoA pyrophosphatase [Bacteroidia bacterium]|nr:CoA pyrophosphatase [Bacteroidia bacterium]
MSGATITGACTLTAEDIRTRLDRHTRQSLRKEGYRYASVLVPLMEDAGEWRIILTRRNSDLPHHQGQIAFPGGSVDVGETVEQAALRETHEEIGLLPEHVTLLGCHNDIWTPSGFIITPVVGIVSADALFEPNPAEVARIFTVPFCFFADEANVERRILQHEGVAREVLYHHWDGEIIWGATALIIRNLLDLLAKP